MASFLLCGIRPKGVWSLKHVSKTSSTIFSASSRLIFLTARMERRARPRTHSCHRIQREISIERETVLKLNCNTFILRNESSLSVYPFSHPSIWGGIKYIYWSTVLVRSMDTGKHLFFEELFTPICLKRVRW